MPTLYAPPARDAYVSALEPEKNFGEDSKLLVGRDSTNWLRSFIQFDLSGMPNNITITEATMKLYLLENSQPTVSKVIDAYAVIQSWQEDEVTFANQPLFEETPYAEVTITNEINTFIAWDISTLLRDWKSGSLANIGIALDSTDPWVGFASSNALVTTLRVKPVLLIEYQPVLFVTEAETGLTTTDQVQYSLARNVSGARQVSFFVNNTGTNQVTVQLELSPEGITYMIESDPIVIPPSRSTILVPRYFTQYARVGYKSTSAGAPSTLNIWFQAQAY